MPKLAISIVLGVALVCAVGCVPTSSVTVESGEYVAIRGSGETSPDAVRLLQSIHIDREAGTVRIALAGGGGRTLRITSRAREQWPTGCPGNLSNTRMEVLEIEGETLAIGPLILDDPILVRDCPDEPVALVLRSDGAIGGGGGACVGADECIRFEPLDSAAVQRLPSSIKGYELYSWRTDDGWWFTLITGTNRTKTWSEITAPEGRVTDDGWVKLTVQGADDLRDTLRGLPSGEMVAWVGPNAYGQGGGAGQPAPELPDDETVAAISAYCERLGIELAVVR